MAFILFPVAVKLESWGAGPLLAAFLSILGLVLIIVGCIILFSDQVFRLSHDLNDFKDRMLEVFADITLFVNSSIGFLPRQEKAELLDGIKGWVNGAVATLIGQTVSGTAEFVFGLLAALVFIFLILIYRKGLVNALVQFYAPEHREKAHGMFRSVQKVGQQYLFGMMVIMLILGVINSLGLWVIGIDHPFLFGFLAAALALIPYAGTLLGAVIPMVFSIVVHDSVWMPITIAIFFWSVQFLEGNILTPKIVGGNMKINAMTSILSIIIGASVWGIAGMIIFLPFAAMLKVVCEQYEGLRPVALLIGEHHTGRTDGRIGFMGRLFERVKARFNHFRAERRRKRDMVP
jgi:predicted PurR-regulated permease PerM